MTDTEKLALALAALKSRECPAAAYQAASCLSYYIDHRNKDRLCSRCRAILEIEGASCLQGDRL